MRRISVLMALLITGYILGVWNFLLMPKYYIAFGLKGFLLSIIVLGLGMILISSEIEATRNTRYLMHEFMVKVARLPAVTLVILMFLMVSGGAVLYYSSRALLPIFSLSKSLLIPAILGTVLLAIILLLIFKARTVEFLGAMAVLLIVFTPLATFLLRSRVDSFVKSQEAINYLNSYRDAIFSFSHPLNLEGVALMVLTVLLSLGLGAGVYYVLGSFFPSDLDLKKLLGVVVLLQILLSFSAAMTTVYAIGAAYQGYENAQAKYEMLHEALGKVFANPKYTAEEAMQKYNEIQEALKKVNQTLTNFHKIERYAKDSTENPVDSVETFYLMPGVMRESRVPNAGLVIALLMGSLFLAGFTSLIVLIEIGGQISSEVFQMKRTGSILFVSSAVTILGAVMAIGSAREILLFVVVGFIAFYAAIEVAPLLRGPSPVDKRVVGTGAVFVLLVGLLGLLYLLKIGSTSVYLGLLLGLLILTPLLFNGYLMASARSR